MRSTHGRIFDVNRTPSSFWLTLPFTPCLLPPLIQANMATNGNGAVVLYSLAFLRQRSKYLPYHSYPDVA
jgi:hypothetical protein